MLQFSDAFADALRRFPPRPTPGLVEQQAWFRRLKDEPTILERLEGLRQKRT